MIAGHARAVLLSFEGPDAYAMVGGLATRVVSLARALGEADVATDLIFVGDPAAPALESFAPNVTLRRWSQWLSVHHPANVYDGEAQKVDDYTRSVPRFLADAVIEPAYRRGERVLVIAEEWHTVGATIALDRLLRERGLRDDVTIVWNANNTYGFDAIPWAALQRAAGILTISKYMKFELARAGVPSLVVPNGIDETLLDGPSEAHVRLLREALHGRPNLFKVGRFDADKNWLQAVDAVAELKALGRAPLLVARGGRESYGDLVWGRARERGLVVERVAVARGDAEALAAALAASAADIVDLRSFVTDPLLQALYVAADAVLANSGKEPFGLVGLEVMAAGGIAVTGSTGEDYALPFVNAIVCDTVDGRELATYLHATLDDDRRTDGMKKAGYETANRYLWANVLDTFERKLLYLRRTSD